MKVWITRDETSAQGTFGRLIIENGENREYWFTGELPWRNNQRSISCIAVGSYRASVVYWPQHKKYVYQLQNVKGRDGILIHAANLMGDRNQGYRSQLEGCIALGEQLGFIDGQRALLVSPPAIRRFMSLLDNQPFELTISGDF